MGDFVKATGQPIVTNDLNEWRGFHKDVEYRAALGVQCTEVLKCPGECCIPMLGPDPSALAGDLEHCNGIVSLHYQDFATMPPILEGLIPTLVSEGDGRVLSEVEESLILMGSLTTGILTDLRRAQQLKTARALAVLAETHLTRYTVDPKQVRREYLEAVIQLIKGQLRVTSVSFFCRMPEEDRIVCVASSGLRRAEDGAILTGANLIDASYSGDKDQQRRTWQVFDSGELAFLETAGDSGKYQELNGAGKTIKGMMLVYPIRQTKPAPTDLNDSPSNRQVVGPTLGVVRIGHEATHGDLLTFDIVELKTLEFIVDQISPVLHTLESRIQREEVIQIVKHDFLAPLAAIRDAVDHIVDAESRGRRADEYYLDNLRETALRLGGLAELLSRDPEARRPLFPKKTNIEAQIVAPMKRMLTPYADQTSRMSIHFTGIDQIPPLNIDRSLIERALYNLIVNAVKYGARETTIHITGHVLPTGYAIDVENEGPGVEEKYKDRLFTPYFRSPTAKATRQGEGLGLSVVRGIMRSHRGDVTLEKLANRTIFRLFFPAHLKA